METVLIFMLCLATEGAPDAQHSQERLPVHGTIHKSTLHGFFGEKNDDYGLDAIPIDSPPKGRSKVYGFPGAGGGFPGNRFWHKKNNFRHQIKFNSILISMDHLGLYQWKFVDLHLYNSKGAEAFFEKYPNSRPDQLPRLTLYDKYERIAVKELGSGWRNRLPTDVLGYGSVPTSEKSCKSYILPKKTKQFEIWDSNFRWDEKRQEWKIKPSPRFEKIGTWAADLDSSDIQKRKRAFEELENLGRMARSHLEKLLEEKPTAETRKRLLSLLGKMSGPSKGDELWEDAENYETFPSLFLEDFYFFLRNNDYYFVTQSGKLYVAAPPKKGEKARTMKSLWQGDNFPIAGIIEDADNDKVWLFTKSKRKLVTQAVFFEMAAEIRTEKFDHAKLAPVNIDSRARPLLEYLPLIRAKAKKQQEK